LTGGAAAKVYGSKRKLADIDIEIPEKFFKIILPKVKKYSIFGPAKYHDKEWDIFLLTLKFRNQKIDLSGSKTEKIYNKIKHRWELQKIKLTGLPKKQFLGVSIPIIPKNELIAYKSKILRAVDKRDLEALK
jgi:hypothetical protein